MEKLYLSNNKSIERMLPAARMLQTNEENSIFSYKGKKVIVPNYLLRGLMPAYDDRTMNSLTGIGVGTVLNMANFLVCSQTLTNRGRKLQSSRKAPKAI